MTTCTVTWSTEHRVHGGTPHACGRDDGHAGRCLCDCGRWSIAGASPTLPDSPQGTLL